MNRHWKEGRDYKYLLAREDNIAVLLLEDPFTPVIVAHVSKDCSATYDCAYGEGVVHANGNFADYELSEDENALLDKVADEVEDWFDEQRPEGWDG